MSATPCAWETQWGLAWQRKFSPRKLTGSAWDSVQHRSGTSQFTHHHPTNTFRCPLGLHSIHFRQCRSAKKRNRKQKLRYITGRTATNSQKTANRRLSRTGKIRTTRMWAPSAVIRKAVFCRPIRRTGILSTSFVTTSSVRTAVWCTANAPKLSKKTFWRFCEALAVRGVGLTSRGSRIYGRRKATTSFTSAVPVVAVRGTSGKTSTTSRRAKRRAFSRSKANGRRKRTTSLFWSLPPRPVAFWRIPTIKWPKESSRIRVSRLRSARPVSNRQTGGPTWNQKISSPSQACPKGNKATHQASHGGQTLQRWWRLCLDRRSTLATSKWTTTSKTTTHAPSFSRRSSRTAKRRWIAWCVSVTFPCSPTTHFSMAPSFCRPGNSQHPVVSSWNYTRRRCTSPPFACTAWKANLTPSNASFVILRGTARATRSERCTGMISLQHRHVVTDELNAGSVENQSPIPIMANSISRIIRVVSSARIVRLSTVIMWNRWRCMNLQLKTLLLVLPHWSLSNLPCQSSIADWLPISFCNLASI